MNKKKYGKALAVLKILISVILSAAAAASMLGAILINGARDYFQSSEFRSQVENADLGSMMFTVNGERVTVSDYVKECAQEYIEQKIPYSYFLAGIAVDAAVNSETVTGAVKSEVFELIDYFLNSSADEARERLENGEIDEEYANPDIESARSVDEAIRLYVRAFVMKNFEKTVTVPADKMIVLLSESTATKLAVICAVLLLAVVIINFKTLFNCLVYGSAVSFAVGIVIKAAQSRFESLNEGATDLVGYVFLKPFADSYSSAAIKAFISGAVLLAAFALVVFAYNKFSASGKDAQKTA